MISIGTTKNAASPRLKILQHGRPKIGKTWLIRTIPVENDQEILYFGADPGELAINDRDFARVVVPNNAITEDTLNQFYNYLVKSSHKYKWVVVDGLDDIAEKILWHRMDVNKDDRASYKEMGRIMKVFITKVRDIDGISSLFITHSKEEEDDMKRRIVSPNIPGQKLATEMLGLFDIVLCYRWFNHEGKNVRGLQTSMEVDTSYICGDRSGCLPPIIEPDLGGMIQTIVKAGKKVSDDDDLVSPSAILELTSLIQMAAPDEQAKLKVIIDKFKAENKLENIKQATVAQWKVLKSSIFDN